jgi:hypothetical protein
MASVACAQRESKGVSGTAVYQRRRPERSTVYQVVQGHLETWLAECRYTAEDGFPVAGYIEEDLRKYLQCGILAHGFARARCDDCGYDFLIAYSCKGRGVCGSCNTRRMVETAAHLVDEVFPRVPVRQWVLSFPKRLRYFLARDADLVNSVLRIFLNSVEKALQSCCADAPDHARLGAVTFVHLFGSALNGNIHLHCCVIDGLFSAEDETLRFDEATITPEAMAKVQAEARERVLRLFKRRSLLSPEDVETMRQWKHEGGFSLNADVTVAAWDRAGLERLLRYCARPIFASERLQWLEKDQRLVYRLPKSRPDGQAVLYLTPLEFLDKLAVLIPPPRKHRHRYHGVLAPNAPLRQAVTAYAGLPINAEVPATGQALVAEEGIPEAESKAPSYAASLWAMLIARIYEVFPLVCPQCGGELKIVAFLIEADPIQRILLHIGEPATPPRIAPARAPPDWFEVDFDQTILDEPDQAEPVPEFEFDQTVSG